MAEYQATVSWERGDAAFTDNRYSRGHRWRFDGGLQVPASASPHIVPPPMSVEAAVDPEEALVASLASCHMLFFLSISAQRRLLVESYRDHATGVMTRDASGKQWLSHVMLRPAARFGGERRPGREEVLAIHHAAHEECFIARSVKSEVRCEPVWD